ncbi:MAG TPA: hypothetical protein GXX29_01550 [Firmicutes bacterium]|nr:hypothetical protein [Bacillota bacterium]
MANVGAANVGAANVGAANVGAANVGGCRILSRSLSIPGKFFATCDMPFTAVFCKPILNITHN